MAPQLHQLHDRRAVAARLLVVAGGADAVHVAIGEAALARLTAELVRLLGLNVALAMQGLEEALRLRVMQRPAGAGEVVEGDVQGQVENFALMQYNAFGLIGD